MPYDGRYDTPRGRWIGDAQYALTRPMLRLRSGDSMLGVGRATARGTSRLVQIQPGLAA